MVYTAELVLICNITGKTRLRGIINAIAEEEDDATSAIIGAGLEEAGLDINDFAPADSHLSSDQGASASNRFKGVTRKAEAMSSYVDASLDMFEAELRKQRAFVHEMKDLGEQLHAGALAQIRSKHKVEKASHGERERGREREGEREREREREREMERERERGGERGREREREMVILRGRYAFCNLHCSTPPHHPPACQTDPISLSLGGSIDQSGETGAGAVEEPPKAPENDLRGLDIPYCLRIHMREFSAKPRVMMKKQMMKFVYQVYWDKLAVDEVRRKDGMEPQPFGETLALYLGKKYGLQKLADHKIAEVVETCALSLLSPFFLASFSSSLTPRLHASTPRQTLP